jgi:C-terminal processing protease CtpA/Prc
MRQRGDRDGLGERRARGAIVGERTRGSHDVSLPAGWMFVRLSEVAGPKYEQIEGVGTMPDIEVALTEADKENGRDP